MKAKSPGSYGTFSDAEIGKRIKAQNPQQYSMFQDVGAPKVAPTLPENLPETMLDKSLQAIPPVAAAIAGLATGGAGLAGAMAGAAGASATGGGASLLEQGLRYVTNQRPPQGFDELSGRVMQDTLTAGTTELGGRALTGTLEKTLGKWLKPERLYQRALQPSGGQQEASKVVESGLGERIRLDPAAAEKVRFLKQKFDTDVENVFTAPQNMSSPQLVANARARFDKLRDQYGRITGSGPGYRKQIDEFQRAFEEKFLTPAVPPKPILNAQGQPLLDAQGKPMLTAGQPARPKIMSAREAQDLKASTYREIRSKSAAAFDPFTNPKLHLEMHEELASALKQELEAIYPQLKDLNKRLGGVISLEPEIDMFLKREMSGSSGLKGSSLSEIATNLLRKFQASPETRSQLAILLKQAGQKPAVRFSLKAGKFGLEQAPRTATYEFGSKPEPPSDQP